MKLFIPIFILSCLAVAEDIKSLPNQAGNGNIDLAGTVVVNPNEVQELVGAPLEPGYIVVRLKASPRTVEAIRISSDDFTLISRKDGERSPALDPNQIGASGGLALKSRTTHDGSPGVSSTQVGVAPGEAGKTLQKGPDALLLKLLESKILPTKVTKEPVEGLLYFLLEGKNKPKDLGLLYKGPAGRLAMDFK